MAKNRFTMVIATDAQNKSRRSRNPNIYKRNLSAPKHNKNRTEAQKRFTMVIATNAQNKSRRHRNPNIYIRILSAPKHDKTELRKRKNLRWLWPPTHQTNAEDVEVQTFCGPPNTKTNRTGAKKRLTMAMATNAQNKSRRRRNPNM